MICLVSMSCRAVWCVCGGSASPPEWKCMLLRGRPLGRGSEEGSVASTRERESERERHVTRHVFLFDSNLYLCMYVTPVCVRVDAAGGMTMSPVPLLPNDNRTRDTPLSGATIHPDRGVRAQRPTRRSQRTPIAVEHGSRNTPSARSLASEPRRPPGTRGQGSAAARPRAGRAGASAIARARARRGTSSGPAGAGAGRAAPPPGGAPRASGGGAGRASGAPGRPARASAVFHRLDAPRTHRAGRAAGRPGIAPRRTPRSTRAHGAAVVLGGRSVYETFSRRMTMRS